MKKRPSEFFEDIAQKLEELRAEIKRLNDELNISFNALLQSFKNIQNTLEENLQEKTKQQRKGIVILLDTLNLLYFLRQNNLLFPSRIIDDIVAQTGQRKLFAYAFSEFVNEKIKDVLERSGFQVIYCSNADQEILNIFYSFLIESPEIEKIFLITGDKALAHKCSMVIAQGFPEKELIWLYPSKNSLQDERRHFLIKLLPKAETQDFFVLREEEEVLSAIFCLLENRAFDPYLVPLHRFLLIVLYLLSRKISKEQTKRIHFSFHRLAEVVADEIQGNIAIRNDPYLERFVSKDCLKWVKIILDALLKLDEKDRFILKIESQSPPKVFYQLDENSENWKKIVGRFGEIRRYFE